MPAVTLTFVDRVKFAQNEYYSAKSGDFLRFFCLPLPWPLIISVALYCSTKVSEISDMAKPSATFCCSGYYKEY